MNSPVNKVVVGKPIEKLLKNSALLAVDTSSVNDSLARLEALRQTYIQSPTAGRNVFKLPGLEL
ncbi:hypothetical protein TH63_03970 [Rufibacter radiotolerans]|uniref:Uncharacterized protein n=1 Tax=Rufibacter radiotolerans TaxID=1379910 RepID=A0A0H4W3F3_9BACT|nr:hypothetical protein [Rufibacter radiotolerans]AKQ44976.1 hypothetical protein TH63_03970 [Rufibacter radiotolerans]